jgi:hypothetical protein
LSIAEEVKTPSDFLPAEAILRQTIANSVKIKPPKDIMHCMFIAARGNDAVLERKNRLR